MKIIHTADLHLESKMHVNLDKSKSKERRTELLYAFERLIKQAISEDVRVIIIAGDMFDTSSVKESTKKYILGLFKNNPDIDFLYLPGNHDEDNLLTFEELPKNVFQFSDEWKQYTYNDVCISGIIFNDQTSKYLYDTLKLDENMKNIVVMHGQISNYNVKECINLKLLENKNIDYLALGHIHSYDIEKLDDRGIYAYCGCLEGRGFDEIGPKGYLLLDTDQGMQPRFIKNCSRCLYDIEFDITNCDDWYSIEQGVFSKLSYIRSEDIVKLRLKGYYKISLIKQIESLSLKINDQFYFGKVVDESKLEINISDYEHEVSLKSEYILKVMASNKTDEDKQKLIEIGLKALLNEEL